jgi:hypothetical protein
MSSTRQQAAELYHQLHLEIQHIREDIAYSDATSFCDDCPHRRWDLWEPQSYHDLEYGPSIADFCCKEEPDYRQADYEHIRFCEKLMADLKTFAGDEELAAAQSRVAKK